MSVKNRFLPCDEWLYFKIYTGEKVAEELLVNRLLPFCEKMFKTNSLDKWFFIRYHDPDFHIRFRFKLKDTSCDEFIRYFNEELNPLFEQMIIFSVEIHPYMREIERYGETCIDEAETLFWAHSESTLKMLLECADERLEDARWKFAVAAVDSLASDFKLSARRKVEFYKELTENYISEFKFKSRNIHQLDKKFREFRLELNELLLPNHENANQTVRIKSIVSETRIRLKSIIESISLKYSDDQMKMPLENLISSYMHMLCNRIFIVDLRKNEFVIYYLLYKFYRSELAKHKNKSL